MATELTGNFKHILRKSFWGKTCVVLMVEWDVEYCRDYNEFSDFTTFQRLEWDEATEQDFLQLQQLGKL